MSMRSRLFALSLTLILTLFLQSCASLHQTPINYVSIDLHYTPYEEILKQVKQKYGPMKSRGEAHVTVITPPEFNALLKYMSAEDIQKSALIFTQNRPSIKQICLGRSQVNLAGVTESTFYVVIQSAELNQYRKALADSKAVPKSVFDPALFFPHVTIGFTNRDLHYEDGVRKNVSTCLQDFKLNNEN